MTTKVDDMKKLTERSEREVETKHYVVGRLFVGRFVSWLTICKTLWKMIR